MTGIVVAPDGGERLERGPRAHRVLAELPELEAIELSFGPGFEVPLHTHEDHSDAFYVLEGEAEFLLGDDVVRHAGPGTWVVAPSGTRHGFRNAGPGDLRLLNVHAPNTGFVEGVRRDRPDR